MGLFAICAFFVVAVVACFTHKYFVAIAVYYTVCVLSIHTISTFLTVCVVFVETIIAYIAVFVTNIVFIISVIFMTAITVVNTFSAVIFAIDIDCFVVINFASTICAIGSVSATAVDVF